MVIIVFFYWKNHDDDDNFFAKLFRSNIVSFSSFSLLFITLKYQIEISESFLYVSLLLLLLLPAIHPSIDWLIDRSIEVTKKKSIKIKQLKCAGVRYIIYLTGLADCYIWQHSTSDHHWMDERDGEIDLLTSHTYSHYQWVNIFFSKKIFSFCQNLIKRKKKIWWQENCSVSFFDFFDFRSMFFRCWWWCHHLFFWR